MIIDHRKLYAIRGTLFMSGAAILFLILYWVLALPLFHQMQIQALKRCYQQVTELQLTDLDEEDEEILDTFRTSKIGIAIADENLNLLYKSFDKKQPELMNKYFADQLDQFLEKPSVEVRRYSAFEVIRLRGKAEQEGEVFYIFLRRELTGMGDLIGISSLYFAVVMLLLVLLGWRMLARRRSPLPERSVTVPNGEKAQLQSAQKEFVANVSHELKTPLAVISSQVEMLQKMGNEIDREYYYASIREEIEKMSGMVGNLLDLTILEHHLEQMELQELSFSELMEYMLLKYEALFRKKELKVIREIEDDCIVLGNRRYLEEAVNNYLMNAFQHTGEGKSLKIALKKEKSMACLEVTNQGNSIPQNEQDQIWQSFYSNMTNGTGTVGDQKHAGIGLYVVKNIVEQHCGTCGVENVTDGVKFWIRLPLRKDR